MKSMRLCRDRFEKLTLLTVVLALGLAATSAVAQEGPGDERLPPQELGWRDYLPRAGIGYEVGRGIGYPDGYGRAAGLIPLAGIEGELLVFSDLRLLVDDDGHVGSNTGLGYRYYLAEVDRTFGAVLYYDLRDTEMKTFQQLTVSFDTLGQWWDLRTNVYVQSIFSNRAFEPTRFVDDYLFLSGEENALSGLDMELTVPLPVWQSFDPRIGAGWYYLQGDNLSEFWGWKLRAEASVADSVVVDLGLHNDQQFGTTVNLGLTWWFPTKWAQRRGMPAGRREPAQRLGEPIERLENIAVMSHPSEVARDPNTGDPLRFLHVAPQLGQGKGSFRSPYGSLAEALNDPRYQSGTVDIIYVRSDPHSPLVHSGHVDFVPGVQLRSNGPVQWVETQQGPVRLPFSGANPELTSYPEINGNIFLANDSYLSGFSIHGSVRGTDVSNVTIAENRITPSNLPPYLEIPIVSEPFNDPGDFFTESIALNRATGTVVIRDNFIANRCGVFLGSTQGATVSIAENVFQCQKGILCSGGDLTAEITGNTMVGHGRSLNDIPDFATRVWFENMYVSTIDWDSVGIQLTSDLTFTGNITRNRISDYTYGISMSGYDGITPGRLDFNGTISDNQIRTNVISGIAMNSVDFTGAIRNNTISGNEWYAINGDFGHGQFNGDIVGNRICDNEWKGIYFEFSTSDVNHRMALLDNEFSGNGSEISSGASNGRNIFDISIVQKSDTGALYLELDGNTSHDSPVPGSDGHNYELTRLGLFYGHTYQGQYYVHLGENTGVIGAWDEGVFPGDWINWPNWPQ